MSNQKLMIIARGPSGSGKSKMVQKLSVKLNAPVFTSDAFFMQSGRYIFDPQKLGLAHEWNQQRVRDAASKGVPVIIVDNTNTQFFEMKPYVEIAVQYGYTVEFKEPDWTEELRNPDGTWNVEFLSKMQNQPDREKSVPPQIIQKMVERYQYDPTIEQILKAEKPEFLK